MAEGAPLLREYVGKTCIKGSNPFDSASEPQNARKGVFSWARQQLQNQGSLSLLKGDHFGTQ